MVVIRKQLRRAHRPPQGPFKSFRLLDIKEAGKYHDVEKSRDSLSRKVVSVSIKGFGSVIK